MSGIVLNRLSKTFNMGDEAVLAVKDASLTIGSGEFVAVMGPSGSGKSTLLSLMGGLQHPTGGSMFIEDIDVFGLSAERRADFRREFLGFVFQSFHLVPYLTVLENVMLPLTGSPLSRSKQREMAREKLASVGLSSKEKRLPNALSGGEQQRTAIARALVNNPSIILADEPTGNLDSATSGEVMALLRSINKEGRTIVMVTHNNENLSHVSRCIRMLDGGIQSA